MRNIGVDIQYQHLGELEGAARCLSSPPIPRQDVFFTT